MTRLAALAGVFASSLLWVSTAGAETITIGLCSGATCSTITTEASGTNSASFSGSTAAFTTINVSGAGPANPLNLLSDDIDIASGVSATNILHVFVTEQGVTGPVGAAINFASSFTSNALSAGWTLTEQTFLDPANGLFTTTGPLSSAPFTTIGTQSANAIGNTGSPGPYSVTEEYTITTHGFGNTNDTIDLSATAATPIPGALPLFAAGIGMMGLLARRRKRNNSALAAA
jgi:hypothetical protein